MNIILIKRFFFNPYDVSYVWQYWVKALRGKERERAVRQKETDIAFGFLEPCLFWQLVVSWEWPA